ncbi:hypothetical protein JCGZ_15782 [Jatropha curcas]|uniref:WW domain-containing protein n=1 Tax=Jatropha curcas TaxID=180498 RepID=A0A067LA44_JATCU|nr:uncharacterized protein LOC105630607 [Jatropha curcas]KDP41375.1 hypothetical protein JCGZ_15782 [Jatropha curcas]
MVSLHKAPASSSPNGTKTSPTGHQFDYSSKKRKWDDDHDHDKSQTEGSFHRRSSKPLETIKSLFEIELQLETPLPLEWQRCLDIQSGEIHFYNTRTQKRTTRDPRRSPEPEPASPPSSHMSLELELNLPCDQSQRKNISQNDNSAKQNNNFTSSIEDAAGLGDLFMDSRKDHNSKNAQGQIMKRCPSWLAFEEDKVEEEMVAAVCTKCYMLVMLCKSSPSCPNCKFMHPQPDQNHLSSNKLFKQRLSLLC